MHFIRLVKHLQLKHTEHMYTQHEIIEPQTLRKLVIDRNQGTTVEANI